MIARSAYSSPQMERVTLLPAVRQACDPGVILHPRHRVLAEKSKCEVGASKIPQPLVLQDDASRLLLRDFPNLGVGERTGSLPLQMLVWLRCESHLLPYLPLISFS